MTTDSNHPNISFEQPNNGKANIIWFTVDQMRGQAQALWATQIQTPNLTACRGMVPIFAMPCRGIRCAARHVMLDDWSYAHRAILVTSTPLIPDPTVADAQCRWLSTAWWQMAS